jgi:hypothetical protein
VAESGSVLVAIDNYSILRAIGLVLGVPVAWFYAEDDGLADRILHITMPCPNLEMR